MKSKYFLNCFICVFSFDLINCYIKKFLLIIEWVSDKMTVDGAAGNEQVIFVTGSYDHTIKIWQAHTGLCQRTVQHTESVSLWSRFLN